MVAHVYFGPDDEEAFGAFRDQLVDDFAPWAEDASPPVDGSDLGLLLDWKWGYGGGRMDRWELADIEEFLLDWCPRKVSVPPDLAARIPANVAEAFRFLAARGLLGPGSAPAERLAAFALSKGDAFVAAMTDPANFGMAKSLFGSIGIEDPASLSADNLQQLMDDFNARPFEERRQITDGALSAPPALPTVGPVLLPDPDAVRAGADASPLLAGFDALSDYFAAPGRNLTAAGNLTMADARALVTLLDTGEQEETAHGDLTFRKRSATQFGQLDHWQWWARQAGVLRQQGRKLVAVKAWRQRRRREPLLELRRAVDVLRHYGALTSYRSSYLGFVDQLLDSAVGPVLGSLLNRPDGVRFDEIVALWTDLLGHAGYAPWYPGHVEGAVEDLLTLLERMGLVSWSDAEPATELVGRARREGGQARLSPVGVAIAVDLVADEGVEVVSVPPPAELTAQALAALIDSFGPAEWWSAASGWLHTRPDPSSALGELVELVADRDLAGLLVLLAEVPAAQQELLVPVATGLARRSTAITDELATVAFNWLLLIDCLDPVDADPARMFDASLVTYGILVEADPEAADQLVDDTHDRSEQLAVLAAAGARTSPRVLALLEAIGARHADKVVAKAARKEAFRMRSRLVA